MWNYWLGLNTIAALEQKLGWRVQKAPPCFWSSQKPVPDRVKVPLSGKLYKKLIISISQCIHREWKYTSICTTLLQQNDIFFYNSLVDVSLNKLLFKKDTFCWHFFWGLFFSRLFSCKSDKWKISKKTMKISLNIVNLQKI